MSSLMPTEPPRQPVYLDRPQRLGIVPTFAFWNQPEVWRHARGLAATAAAVWVVVAGALLSGTMPPLMLGLVGALGMVVLLGLLERHVRRGMRARAQLALGASRPEK